MGHLLDCPDPEPTVNQATAVLAMLVTVAAAVWAVRLPRTEGLVVVVGASGVSLAVLTVLGASASRAALALPPLLLVAGYACLAAALDRAGLSRLVAERLGRSPVVVLLVAAAAAAVLSNDVVVVALAPVVLRRPWRAVDAAALFVGANVTGGLLPQGSPTNLILLPSTTFAHYVQVSVPVTVAMVLAATVVFTAADKVVPARLHPPAPPVGTRTPWTPTQRGLGVLALAAVAAQPVCDLFHVPRAALGWALVLLAAGVCLALSLPTVEVVASAPWQLAPVVLVLVAGASFLTTSAPSSMSHNGWVLSTFFVSGTGTDILAAALAAPAVHAGTLSAGAALCAVSAGAFATPVGSVSGMLLLSEHRTAHVDPAPVTFALASVASLACFAAGVAANALPWPWR